MVRHLLTLGPIFCIAVACGYRLGTRGAVLAGVRAVEVPAFESDVRQAGLGPLFARALREELAARARVQVGGAASDAILTGRIKAYVPNIGLAFPTLTPNPITDGGSGLVRIGEFRSVVVAEAILRRRSDNQVIFATGDLSVAGEFLPGPDVMATEANRERTLRQIAADLARRIGELLSDSF